MAAQAGHHLVPHGRRSRARYPEVSRRGQLIDTKPARERAYLIGVLLPDTTAEALAEQMRELAELTRTADGEVVAADVQRRDVLEPASFVGRGKVAEMRERRAELRYDLVICNDDLSPRQQRNLERELDVRVVDRTELILDIFARHARTREGRLQVEAAQLRHALPRLIGAWSYHRQMGGIGTRAGAGEQQIEISRRRIRKRLRDLEEELEQVRAQRSQQRASRQRSELAVVAIVGYTNAGKSTLINRLTGAGVPAEDRLFATLDPTTRRLPLPSGREVLLTDTVGFIQKLPTDLVAAFRATLEEVTFADLVLHVVDAAAPAAREQAATVEEILEQLGAGDKPQVVALNKVDLLGPAGLRRVTQALVARYPLLVAISALRGTGLEELGRALDRASDHHLVRVELLVPYGREAVLQELRQLGDLEHVEYTERGTFAQGRVPRAVAHRFQAFALDGLRVEGR